MQATINHGPSHNCWEGKNGYQASLNVQVVVVKRPTYAHLSRCDHLITIYAKI